MNIPRFHGSAWSTLPPHKRWSIRVQGETIKQQWDLLRDPGILATYLTEQRLSIADALNTLKAYGMSKRERSWLKAQLKQHGGQ